jgi:Nuclease-related domain
MSQPNRSPLQDRPRRHAGQSLEEERRKLIEEKLDPPLLMALFFVLLAAFEWWRDYSAFKPNPWMFTVAAAIAVGFAAWRLVRTRAKRHALRLGIQGEKVVGQYLEGLREKRYVVFHDIVGPTFNIDHVLIGPAGVFTIETKTWSKPVRGDARIRFDGETLIVAGREPDRDPIAQARAQASWLRQQLKESTGKSYETFPVVVFPGWFIEQTPGSLKGLWVLEPKALPAFLDREPQRLTPEDAKLAAYHLSRHIRAGEAERLGAG